MSISKRLRFEVLKRDGFRCTYCGATSLSTRLHVDHVEPASRGGSDDPANLVTACAPCNLGKSDVRLEDVTRTADASGGDPQEHADQVRAYLAAQRDVEAAKDEVLEFLAERYTAASDRGWDMSDLLRIRIRQWVHQLSMEDLVVAVEATARKRMYNNEYERQYFHGVIRNLRAKRDQKAG